MGESNREFVINLDELVRSVYNKVAEWHNEEGSPEEKSNHLKFVCHEVVDLILTDGFAQLEGIRTKSQIVAGETKQEKNNKKTKDSGFFSKFFKKQ